MAETKLLYLDDTYQDKGRARIVDVVKDEAGIALVLDETIFYPQGGGQPSDTGKIWADGIEFAVTKVVFRDGIVYHYGALLKGAPSSGDEVALSVDMPRRLTHAKLHSGGHVIMTAAFQLRGMLATKGYHFPDGPYVEFQGVIPEPEREQFVADIQKAIDELVSSSHAVAFRYSSLDELAELGIHVPAEIPKDKPTRVITTNGYDSPCGGTHVADLSEIGNITIRGIKYKGGKTKVSYNI